MPTFPRGGLVHQGQLDSEISNAVSKLGPEALHVAYSLRGDWTGDPSIFFRIVLADESTGRDTLSEVTGRIVEVLMDELQPIDNWGLNPYFNFRSHSEQQKRYDPEWAGGIDHGVPR